ncbi:hypothetical protein [Bremerella cremea]|uniref:hypothetical protein n=1 Tax=Bremerella cremea TaxID=1031537 RepID=UPI0031E58C51
MKEPVSAAKIRLIDEFEKSADSRLLTSVGDSISIITQDSRIAQILGQISSTFWQRFTREALAAEIEAAQRKFDAEMDAKDLPRIRNVTDWIHLARIVEIPESEIERIFPNEI